MAVKIRESHLKLNKVVFQARYRDGVRLLDRFGALLAKIHRADREWDARSVVLTGSSIRIENPKKKLVSNIGAEYLDLIFSQSALVKDSENNVEIVAKTAEWLYDLTISMLDSVEIIRIGILFEFLAPADNLEESDQFTLKAIRSPLLDWTLDEKIGEPSEAVGAYFFRNAESGIWTQVQLASVVAEQPTGALPAMGFPVEGTGGLGLTVDVYLRPESGQFSKIRVFVNEQFARTKRLAYNLLSRIVSH